MVGWKSFPESCSAGNPKNCSGGFVGPSSQGNTSRFSSPIWMIVTEGFSRSVPTTAMKPRPSRFRTPSRLPKRSPKEWTSSQSMRPSFSTYGVVKVANALADQGVRVIVAGTDMDFRGRALRTHTPATGHCGKDRQTPRHLCPMWRPGHPKPASHRREARSCGGADDSGGGRGKLRSQMPALSPGTCQRPGPGRAGNGTGSANRTPDSRRSPATIPRPPPCPDSAAWPPIIAGPNLFFWTNEVFRASEPPSARFSPGVQPPTRRFGRFASVRWTCRRERSADSNDSAFL